MPPKQPTVYCGSWELGALNPSKLNKLTVFLVVYTNSNKLANGYTNWAKMCAVS